jgi:prevent-host-death family protein
MTMYRGTKTVAAAEFKAKCLQLLDEVARTRKALVVTKRGRPVARVVPLEPEVPLSLEGSVSYGGDIVGPTGEAWDADR